MLSVRGELWGSRWTVGWCLQPLMSDLTDWMYVCVKKMKRGGGVTGYGDGSRGISLWLSHRHTNTQCLLHGWQSQALSYFYSWTHIPWLPLRLQSSLQSLSRGNNCMCDYRESFCWSHMKIWWYFIIIFIWNTWQYSQNYFDMHHFDCKLHTESGWLCVDVWKQFTLF